MKRKWIIVIVITIPILLLLCNWTINLAKQYYFSFMYSPPSIEYGNLINPESNVKLHFPDWSPDSKKLVVFGYEEMTPDFGHLYIINLEDNDIYSITEAGGYFTNPDWSPDGNSILFWAGDYSPPGIWMSKIDGSDQEYIADGRLAYWSTNGDQIAIVKYSIGELPGNNKVEILLFDLLSNSTFKIFSREEGYSEIEEITWSPNGEYITFLLAISYEELGSKKWTTNYRFYVYEIYNNTFLEKMSFDFPINKINWSQDSKKILYVGDQFIDAENRINTTFHILNIENEQCYQFKILGVTGGQISPDGLKLLQEESGGQIFLVETNQVFINDYWNISTPCEKFP